YVPHDPLLYDRGLRWLLSFQCRDGGWAAFDKDITNPLLEQVPFADHNAILDPTCANITARVLEVLASFDFPTSHTVVSRAIRYLRRRQEPDGSWYGRWGVNYVYGTWQVLKGLNAIGLDMNQRWIQRGREWLERHQNADGGWGESCGSYNQPSLRGRGKSTPSQTAWALMGLLSFPDCNRDSIRRGVEFLLRNQNADGSWDEHLITGTGFPRVFYLKYDMYRNNWPLLALALYEKRLGAELYPELESVESGSRADEAMAPAFGGAVGSVASLPGVEFLKELFARLNHG
ncbi:MAG: hypothetical protein JO308_10685, partial [Verrucomicrobia bacterium]|nr:hypothetical protein [Verrucomicrobiota bacterium]